MKKYIYLALLFFVSSFVFADLYTTKRYGELEVTSTAGFSNNSIALSEILKKDLVIDVKKLVKDIPNDGMKVNTNFDAKVAFNVNTRNVRVSLYNLTEGTVNFGIERSLFEYIAKGNIGVKSKNFDIEAFGDVYNTTGVSVFARLKGFGITVAPELFVPIVYMPDVETKMSIQNKSNGIQANFAMNLVTYSAVDIDNASSINVGDVIKNAGFALSGAVERKIFSFLDIGGYLNLPLVPGKLSYKRTQKITFDMEIDDLMGKIDDKDSDAVTNNFSTGDAVTEKVDQQVYKPLRFGVEAALRPFGAWFTVRGMFGVGMRNPYDADQRKVFPEYDFGLDLSLFKILEGSIHSAYRNKVFMQSLGIVLNLRIIELDAKLILQGPDFANSFKLYGAGAYVGFKIGF